MRVFLVAVHFAEYAYRLAAALGEHHRVLLVVEEGNFFAEMGADFQHPTDAGFELRMLRHVRSPARVLGNVLSLRDWLAAFKPDVVHLQDGLWDFVTVGLYWFSRYPLVLTIHDPAPHSGEQSFKGVRKRYHLYRWLLRRGCDVAIAHGEYLRGEVERLLPRLAGRVHAIAHGPLGGVDARPVFDWEPGCLLFFGRAHPYKGLPYFIEAVEMLGSQGRQVRGLVVGRGDDLPVYRARMQASGLFEVNEGFLPHEKLAEVFHRAQVVVLPYTDGTQSGVAGLAMAHARAVVATRVGSIPEMVREGETGWLVPPRDSRALAGAIARLLDNPEQCRVMGEAAWRLAHGELSWTRIAERTAMAYEHAARLRRS